MLIAHTSLSVPRSNCDVPLFGALASLKAEADHKREVCLLRLTAGS